MREILFRGKTFNGNEWVVGAGVYKSEGYTWIITDDVTKTANRGTGSDAIIPATIGQFTGLTDKNGKKIFEGDIVWGDDITGTWHKGVIEYDESIGSFIINTQNFTQYRKNENNYDLFGNWNIEGNIHDNPELLKGGE